MTVQQLQIAEHHLQQIVEIMGDPAGQLSDCFHMPGLPQRRFHAFALRHFGAQTLVGDL